MLGLVPFRRCNWLHSRGMSVGISHLYLYARLDQRRFDVMTRVPV